MRALSIIALALALSSGCFLVAKFEEQNPYLGDADGDSDGDSDADSDVESDGDTDGDTDGEVCTEALCLVAESEIISGEVSSMHVIGFELEGAQRTILVAGVDEGGFVERYTIGRYGGGWQVQRQARRAWEAGVEIASVTAGDVRVGDEFSVVLAINDRSGSDTSETGIWECSLTSATLEPCHLMRSPGVDVDGWFGALTMAYLADESEDDLVATFTDEDGGELEVWTGPIAGLLLLPSTIRLSGDLDPTGLSVVDLVPSEGNVRQDIVVGRGGDTVEVFTKPLFGELVSHGRIDLAMGTIGPCGVRGLAFGDIDGVRPLEVAAVCEAGVARLVRLGESGPDASVVTDDALTLGGSEGAVAVAMGEFDGSEENVDDILVHLGSEIVIYGWHESDPLEWARFAAPEGDDVLIRALDLEDDDHADLVTVSDRVRVYHANPDYVGL